MGQAKRRGTFKERKAQAIEKRSAEVKASKICGTKGGVVTVDDIGCGAFGIGVAAMLASLHGEILIVGDK